MDENNELLTYIYQVSDMGVKTTTSLINSIKNTENKIKKIVEGQLKGYENFLKESEQLLKKNKVKEIKTNGVLKELMAKMGIKKELIKDNSDAYVADMLTQGFTMGSIEIHRRIDRFEGDADKNILKLAKNLLKFQETNIEILKPYL